MSGQLIIRPATHADLPALVEFLREHWREDHIFVTHPELMLWQHQDPDAPENGLTFILAVREPEAGGNEILGALGFIPFRRFDPQAEWSELALAIWKVRDDSGAPGLGIQMLKTIERMFKPALICAIGTSAMVRPIYQALGYTVGALSHAALFAVEPATGGTIAQGVPADARTPRAEDPAVHLKPVDIASLPGGVRDEDIDALGAMGVPRKSWAYIKNRYLEHPWYDYTVRAVMIDGRIRALLIWRKVDAPGGSLLRIVDVIGEAEVLGQCAALLRAELVVAGCDYIDILHWGVDAEALRAGGFVSPDNWADLTLPNYFAPFEARNIRIEIAFKASKEFKGRTLRLYRGDSDQDRPNRPAELER